MSTEFKQLSQKEKSKWEKKAADDKIRYLNEMKNYVPPRDDDGDDDDDDDDDEEEPMPKKKKKES